MRNVRTKRNERTTKAQSDDQTHYIASKSIYTVQPSLLTTLCCIKYCLKRIQYIRHWWQVWFM